MLAWTCTSPEMTVSFHAEGAAPAMRHPVTVGACACPDGEWNDECKAFYCPFSGERGLVTPSGKVAYQPVYSPTCGALNDATIGDDRWHPDYLAADGPPKPNECKHRLVEFSRNQAQNHFSVSWDYTGQTPAFEGSATVSRVAYPPATLDPQNCIPGPEFPLCEFNLISFPDAVVDQYRVFTNVVTVPTSTTGFGCHHFALDTLPMIPEALSRRTRLIGPDLWEGAGHVLLGWPVEGDAAILSLDPDRLTPARALRVSLLASGGERPDFEKAAFTSSKLDRGLLGLGSGVGEVLVSLGGIDVSGAQDHGLWAGSLDETTSTFRQVATSPVGSGVTLHRPSVFVDPDLGRIVVLAEGVLALGDDASGPISHPPVLPGAHRVYSYELAAGTWRTLGSLKLPQDLQDYSVVHDAVRRRLYVLGGRRTGGYSDEIFEVSLTDLSVLPGAFKLPAAAQRSGATATQASRQESIVLHGGERAGVALSDLWTVDLRQESATQVSAEIPGLMPGQVAVSRGGDRLAVPVALSGDLSVAVARVDLGTGEVETVRLLDLRPGPESGFSGVVVGGAAPMFPVVIPTEVPYPGQPMHVQVMAVESGLRVRILDRRGLTIAESRGTGSIVDALFIGQPGETYYAAVGPGPGYIPGSVVEFTLALTEVDLTESGSYAGTFDLDHLARLGEAMVVAGNWGVTTLSLADPDAPIRLDQLHVAGNVSGMATADSRVCVSRTLAPRDLRCLDASDPADLHWHGPGATALGLGRSVSVHQGMAYVAEGLLGVGLFQLSAAEVPDRPQLTGRLWPGGLVVMTSVQGNLLYVSLLDGQVVVYDLALPGAPVELGRFNASAPVVAVAVHGFTAHLQLLKPSSFTKCVLGLRCERGSVVEVFDVMNPAVAVKVGEYDAGTLALTTAVPFGDRLVGLNGRGIVVMSAAPPEPTP
jgi:hypothetical protein